MNKLLPGLLMLATLLLPCCMKSGETKEARAAALEFVVFMDQAFLNIGTSGLADETVLPRLLSDPAISGPYQTIRTKGSAKLVKETERLVQLLSKFPEGAKKGSKVDLFAELGVQKPTDPSAELSVIVKALQEAFFHYADVAGVRNDFQAKMKKWYNHEPEKAAP